MIVEKFSVKVFFLGEGDIALGKGLSFALRDEGWAMKNLQIMNNKYAWKDGAIFGIDGKYYFLLRILYVH